MFEIQIKFLGPIYLFGRKRFAGGYLLFTSLAEVLRARRFPLPVIIPDVSVGVNKNFTSLQFSGANNVITVEAGKTVGGLTVSGDGSTVTNNGIVTTFSLSGKGTVTAEVAAGASVGKMGFGDTGTYNLINRGTISHTQPVGASPQHTCSTIKAGTINIDNYGTIESKANANDVCAYALLFYNGSTVTIKAYNGSVVRAGKAGYIIACSTSNQVTIKVQDGAKFYNKDTETTLSSSGKLVVEAMP